MNTNFNTPSEKMPEPARPRRTMRPNSLRNAQVMPPYNVDLTLSPSTFDDMHVPANISGGDMSKTTRVLASAHPETDMRRM